MKIMAAVVLGVLDWDWTVATSAWSGFWPWSTPKVIVGHVDVVDGDTIDVGSFRVRLEDIDAPETDQKCNDGSDRNYLCGIAASKALRTPIAAKPVSCQAVGKDAYGRVLRVQQLEQR